MEKAKSMDNGVGIKQKFWEEVLDVACMINQSPTSTLVDKTPHEAWTVINLLFNILEFFIVMFM